MVYNADYDRKNRIKVFRIFSAAFLDFYVYLHRFEFKVRLCSYDDPCRFPLSVGKMFL